MARAVWILLSATIALSADVLVFGPQTYTRGNGKPTAEKKTFRVVKPSGSYTLRVMNRGVTSAVISLNGRTVLDPDDFAVKGEEKDKHDRGDHDADDDRNKNDKDRDDLKFISAITRPVTLRDGTNEIIVELRSKPGTSLTVEVSTASPTIDTTPPTITAVASPTANGNGWNNTNVTVTFTCADNVAVQTCPAPTVVGTEGASRLVSGTAIDTSGPPGTARKPSRTTANAGSAATTAPNPTRLAVLSAGSTEAGRRSPRLATSFSVPTYIPRLPH
jgi:hypothetical protein